MSQDQPLTLDQLKDYIGRTVSLDLMVLYGSISNNVTYFQNTGRKCFLGLNGKDSLNQMVTLLISSNNVIQIEMLT